MGRIYALASRVFINVGEWSSTNDLALDLVRDRYGYLTRSVLAARELMEKAIRECCLRPYERLVHRGFYVAGSWGFDLLFPRRTAAVCAEKSIFEDSDGESIEERYVSPGDMLYTTPAQEKVLAMLRNIDLSRAYDEMPPAPMQDFHIC